MTLVWLNGDLIDQSEARLSTTDRGVTLADGVFETILCVGTDALWASDHFERLKASANQMSIEIPYNEGILSKAITDLLRSPPASRCAIRLTVTRGPTFARGLWPRAQSSSPTCLLTIAPTEEVSDQAVVVSALTRRNEHSPLSRIKSLSYGDNILARREALTRNADDAIMLNTAGNVACAAAGNVFFEIEGRWMTPGLGDGVLGGLARKRFLKELDAIEATLSRAQIMSSSAAFVSNSLGVARIERIEGHRLPGKLNGDMISSIYQTQSPRDFGADGSLCSIR